jgi:acyl-coenzyme A synthetase/AMP-(fatty) acid ligase
MTDKNLASRILSNCQTHGSKPAMIFDSRVVTYGALSVMVSQVAEILVARGLRSGDRVGIANRDFIDNFTTRIAAWTIGAVAVPLDVFSSATQRQGMSDNFQLTHLVEDTPSFIDSDRSISPFPLPPPKDASFLQTAHPAQDPEDYATIALTSGTTGRPAGIAISHSAFLHCGDLYTDYGMLGDDCVFLNTGMHTVTGANFRTYGALCHGGTVVFQPAIDGAESIVNAVQEYDVNSMLVTPKTLHDLLDFANQSQRIPLLSGVTWLIVGGATIAAHLLQEAAKSLTSGTVYMYGATSAGAVALLDQKNLKKNAHSVGRVLNGVQVETLDEMGQPTPPGIPGRVRIKSPTIASEILGAEGRTTGDAIRDGWCYPGDIGVVNTNGFLTILGRDDDVINHAGVKVHPAEVEACLQSCDGVYDAAVVGAPSQNAGQEIVAFIVADKDISAADIVAFCRQKLEASKRPHRISFVETLPRNVGNKVIKRKLLEMLTP